MTYMTVRAGLSGILNAQGFSESSQTEDFKDAPDSEYENTFILRCEDGEADEDNEQQAAFLYDNQSWTVQIAFGQSSQSGGEQMNAIQRKKDTLLTELDDPANWRSFCTLLRYRSWSIDEQGAVIVLKIKLKVKDALTY